jgi:hypothetical protein
VRFSEHFLVARDVDDDWFDPLLNADTQLFCDPFRVYADSSTTWHGSHETLLDFFEDMIDLVRIAGRSARHPALAKVRAALRFPEPAEFCLGYSRGTTAGSGSGAGLQADMLAAIQAAVGLGMSRVDHVESLTLLAGGMGADRISDLTCDVLKERFTTYTADVAARHGLPTQRVTVRNCRWDRTHRRWDDVVADLPINPISGKPVLLCPERFLRDLPTVSEDEFWTWSWANYGEQLRADFNFDIATKISSREKARLARRHPEIAERFLKSLEANPKPPYDIESDPKLLVRWWEIGRSSAFVQDITPESTEDITTFVRFVIERFRHNIEDQDGWRLLWHGTRSRDEKAVQQLFRAVVNGYCELAHVDLTGESNAGRGPVDFKLTGSWDGRALVEIKLVRNSQFWGGLQVQTPIYMKAEGVAVGFFVAIAFSDADLSAQRQEKVTKAAANVSTARNLAMHPVFIDARRKPSASKAGRGQR